MIDLILMVALNPLVALPQTQPAVCREEAPAMFAQFRPCVWPNKCTTETEQVAQFRPCVWPNTCAEQTQPVAQFRPCVWPNKCAVETPTVSQFRPC
ncbi:MAG: hypothetical protein HY925_00125, partial [Elusimicrobia bacterium]|nr:hypothetical protein [Elusimicrobiota bacterium]